MKIIIGETAITLEHARAALAGPITVSLSPKARGLIAKSAETVARLLKTGDAIYGVNTGFGKLAKTRIAAEDLSKLQINIVRSHAAGVGAPLDENVVRLIMLLKINALSQGASGISLAAMETLVALLNADVLPVVPGQGSVGASGDLAPLAHLSLVLIGEGEVLHKGKRLSGAKGLAAAGVGPVALGPKEGLALLNGTQVSTALALSGLIAAERNAAAAILAGALSIDAVMGSDTPFDPRIHALRPHPGQVLAASHYRRLLAGSAIRASHLVDDERVQDPYSFRCQPQVMGACLDMLANAARTLMIEANGVSDNPLVFAEDGAVLSGGNFHAEPVAFAADMIAIAIAEMGSLSERRIAALIDSSISLLPPFLIRNPGLNSGFMIPQCTAAALMSENKQMSHPASRRFSAHLGQSGRPCQHGDPWGATAWADERQSGAHRRHRTDGLGGRHRFPAAAQILEGAGRDAQAGAFKGREPRAGPGIFNGYRSHCRHDRAWRISNPRAQDFSAISAAPSSSGGNRF